MLTYRPFIHLTDSETNHELLVNMALIQRVERVDYFNPKKGSLLFYPDLPAGIAVEETLEEISHRMILKPTPPKAGGAA